ncbi:ankyrin repeat domain-containing protein [Acetobacter garciniae]|nr:ankyrin repeat domain-containing protein [Acetobacter garciniae]
MTRFPRLVSSALLACSLSMLATAPAWASDEEDQAAAEEAQQKAESAKAAKRAAPPAAIPGAAGMDEDSGDHASRDVEPTVALFDAINRGSVTAAREAINRGADLHGHNILGQTPLDMSIDLNRNPITFFLLSLRGSDSTVGGAGTTMIGNDMDGATGDNGSYGGRHGGRAENTSGIPQPSIGFLGFGGS